MQYANWEKESRIKEFLTQVNLKKGIEKSGFPVLHDDKNLYITTNEGNTLVIGSTGSGKTQSVILPMTKLSILSKESFIINDVKGEIYDSTKEKLIEDGYNIIRLNFENPEQGDKWNPLFLAQKLYKEEKKDKALELIEDLGYYLFSDESKSSTDPFWINSTIDYFTGITLYLFEKEKKEINLKDVYEKAHTLNKNTLKELEKNSSIYINLVGTLGAPEETKGSILATFNQKIKKYIQKENLSKMIETSTFDYLKATSEPTAIFIVSGTSSTSVNLIPLFINQAFDIIEIYGKKEKKLNILLDEFDELLPIKDFNKIIHYSRSLKMRFTVVIKSFLDLVNMYGEKDAELIKLCFSNIVYLLSNDIYTLEEISKMCGKKSKEEYLISVEELKLLNRFEAIIIMPRLNPIRTTLIPDYEIDWSK